MRSLIHTVLGILGFLLVCASSAFAQTPNGDATSQEQTHLIKPGETLTAIARTYGVEVREIRELNDLKGSLIYAGRTLKIPVIEGATQRTEGIANSLPPGAYAHRSAAEDVWSKTNLQVLFGDDTSTLIPGEPSNFARRGDPTMTSRGWGNRTRGGSTDSTYVRLGQGQAQLIEHQVSRDEDIDEIAEQYGVSAEEIRRWNKIADVYTGQKIIIYQKIGIRQRKGPQANIGTVKSTLLGVEEEEDGFEATSTQTSGVNQRPNSAPTRTESGTYEALDLGKKEVFYMAHKSLAVGKQVRLSVPGNGGFIAVKVIGRLQQDSEVDYILSPAAAQLIESAGANGTATLLLD